MNWLFMHGIRVNDGGLGSVDSNADDLRAMGHRVDTDSGDYGRISSFGVRKGLNIRARDPDTGELMPTLRERLKPAVRIADIINGHSNAGNFIMQFLNEHDDEYEPDSKLVMLFSPAMSRRVRIPKCVKQMHVFHSKNDRVVGWGAAIAKFWCPGFGTAGAYGYAGDDPRGINQDWHWNVDDHSDWYNPDTRREFFLAHMVSIAEEVFS